MKTALIPALFFGGALLSGCVTDGQPTASAPVLPPVLPTTQYALEAQAREDAPVHLRFKTDHLSANQMTALNNLSARATNADVIITTGPSPAAMDHGRTVSDYLMAKGVDGRSLKLQTMTEHPTDIVSLTLISYRANRPDCNRAWENLSRTASNTPYANYGCAVTANMAAQIADPRDIAAPAASTPSDAGRKSVIMDKYRKGEVTASEDNAAAASAISDAVQ
ncbi:CpaD family pilus assembly lipoprotein [Asticcacaulis machinosus]|uniref:CpaD family pilus assembly lipoprotein n=1 Tax=Asticcacaulis machinosus TaxID=2984211 RepID=A0ABT5HLJ6_9CAUL|nr:CpaD family pilus assembly lipoprotein [Asticcacaulis machinosus]MDC7677120.1 CpaD family pilus assembly lipoprotein [Asticcacaulis machinosus]